MRILALLLVLLSGEFSLAQQQETESPLGFPTTITDLYIPGSKVEPIPRKDSEASLVIRILEVKPASDGFRYDLEVYGLDPGTHRISDYLQRIDATPLEPVEHSLQITTTHPLDSLPEPESLKLVDPEKLGGYRLLSIVLGVLWLGVFLFILFYKKRGPKEAEPPPAPLTLHEKLQGLVTKASDGNLSEDQKAQLERLIVGHWKQKVPELQELPTSQALRKLRSHPEASPLLLKLEEWLHAPKGTASQTDINTLLEPFH